MAAGVLIKPCTIDQKGVGRPAVRNKTFKNIPQHLLHRKIDPPVRRKNETVLILQTEDPSFQGAWLQHASANRIPASPTFFNRRTRTAASVCLVGLVYLVCLVHRVGLVQPNRQDKPNKPNEQVSWRGVVWYRQAIADGTFCHRRGCDPGLPLPDSQARASGSQFARVRFGRG